jgi:mono/diheme cytochrome c family protein
MGRTTSLWSILVPDNSIIRTSGLLQAALIVAITALTLFGVSIAQQAQADPATLKLYKTHCQSCHMANGNARAKPLNLQDSEWKHGNGHKEIAEVIRDGVKGTAMRPFKEKLKPPEIDALADYVKTFEKPAAASDAKK